MGLFEFFFPHEAQAVHTRNLYENQTKLFQHQKKRARLLAKKSKNKDLNEMNSRIADLENDMGFLALLVAGIMTRLDEKQLVQKEDIRDIIHEIDGFDGEVDGKLDINVLKGLSK